MGLDATWGKNERAFSTAWSMASCWAWRIFSLAVFSCVELSMAFFVSIWLRFLSYSLRIFAFSASTTVCFWMVYSSCAVARISFAFSSASFRMNCAVPEGERERKKER